MPEDKKQPEDRPETAFEEVVDEITDAERRTRDSDERRRRRGEAGDAITPNPRAQEQSRGE